MFFVDVVAEAEHGDGGLANGKARRCDHRRQQAFEPLAGLGQLCRNAGLRGMDFGADVVCDETDDPLAIGGR